MEDRPHGIADKGGVEVYSRKKEGRAGTFSSLKDTIFTHTLKLKCHLSISQVQTVAYFCLNFSGQYHLQGTTKEPADDFSCAES